MRNVSSGLWIALALLVSPPAGLAQHRALLIDGQNNHQWRETSPNIKRALESSGLFTVEIVTSPPQGEDLSAFEPDFNAYEVVVSNYNGEPWPRETKASLEAYVRGGGGFVSVHAANNAFPEWKEYNRMIGLGGWGGRNEAWDPMCAIATGRSYRTPRRDAAAATERSTRSRSSSVTPGIPSRGDSL